jgi:hypothetical protein
MRINKTGEIDKFQLAEELMAVGINSVARTPTDEGYTIIIGEEEELTEEQMTQGEQIIQDHVASTE